MVNVIDLIFPCHATNLRRARIRESVSREKRDFNVYCPAGHACKHSTISFNCYPLFECKGSKHVYPHCVNGEWLTVIL